MPKLTRAMSKEIDEKADLKRQFWWVGSCARLFAAQKSTTEINATKALQQRERRERRSCFNLGQALEHQLNFIGHTLDDWAPPKHFTRPLEPCEQRYEVPADSRFLDDGVACEMTVGACKFAVINKDSGERWFEVPEVPHDFGRPCFSASTDSCGTNMGLAGFLEDKTAFLHSVGVGQLPPHAQ